MGERRGKCVGQGRRAVGRIEATEGGPLTVGYQALAGTSSRAAHAWGHHEGSVLELGEWVMSTFRCAANVAER